jgi:ankyrin repeat protein
LLILLTCLSRSACSKGKDRPIIFSSKARKTGSTLVTQTMLGYEDIVMDLCGANAESKLHRYVLTGVVENINAPEKDSRRRTLLHVACSGPTEMCLSCVKLLLQKGARTNVVTGEGHGRTPLMMADSPQVVDCLIDFGADLTQQDAYGHTALAVAAMDGKLPLVKALLKRGAAPQILIASDRGYTPLTAAVRQRHEGIAVLLLRAAVKLPDYDIDAAVWPWKQSVLHEAAEEGYEELVTAALDCGASVNAKIGAGVTALQVAVACRQTGCAQLLRSRGAEL